jgi:hypothetical protein
MDWREYELTVKSIYEALGKDAGVSIECFGNSCKCAGKSGNLNQIDVLTSHSDGIHTYKTSIECKFSDQKVNKDIVMKACEVRDDCNLDKSIIVSKTGFTPDAIRYAEHKNIGLVELREPIEQDLKDVLKKIDIDISPCLPEIIGFQNLSNEELNFELNIDEGYYVLPDGSQQEIRDLINDFFTELLRANHFNETFTKEISFSDETYLRIRNSDLRIKVQLLVITGILRRGGTERVEIKQEDYIWLLMKSIFEKKSFVISPRGELYETSYE